MPAPPLESEPAMMRMRAGFVIDAALLPLLGAKFSMCTDKSFGEQIPRKGSRRRLNCLANIVDDPLHEGRIISFGHDANQGLGARLADDQTPPALELGLGRGDAFAHAVDLERRTPVEPHVLEQLRKRLELAQKLARRRLRFDESSEHL